MKLKFKSLQPCKDCGNLLESALVNSETWPPPMTMIHLRCRCKQVVAVAGAVMQEYLREAQ